ncbi:MAG: sel1 repeat family protein [Blastochloris viridis]|uniref:Sel1 repeat family protein n=1 Tax=Blastochloris viridis TaxID=1079 RepID=A0A6N4R393_BLAVI|nr:MAG: sel1 repeat family protein [Blastochloris viridis]
MRSVSFTAEDLYLDGTARLGHPNDYELNFRILMQEKRSEKPESLYKLALHHLHGYGCTRDTGLALSYFTLASNRGCGSSSYCLYRLYEKDLSLDIALQHLQKAASQGHRFAQQLLAVNRPLTAA